MVRVQLLSGGEGCEVRGNLETADSRWRVGEYFFGGDDDGGLLSATETEGGGGGDIAVTVSLTVRRNGRISHSGTELRASGQWWGLGN